MMSDTQSILDLPSIPEIPGRLIDKINDNKLAIFVGAGVPRLIGCKGWNQLAESVIHKCYEVKLINCYEYKELEGLDNKQKISKAYEIFEINDKRKEFFEVIKKDVQCDRRKKKNRDIHEHIRKLRGLIVTTNVDEYFDESYYPNSIVYKAEELTPHNISRDKIYHIHGSIKNNDSLVFTTSAYFNRYKTRDFQKFIEKIFMEYTVLFIGYGLSDFEILDFVLTKFDQRSSGYSPKHYYLNGYGKHQENLRAADERYFKNLGIELISYSKGNNGFGQLYNVVKAWDEEVNSISIYYNYTLDEIKACIHDFSVNRSIDIVDRAMQLAKDEPAKRYFVEKLIQSEDAYKWFRDLYRRKFFEPVNFKGTKLYDFILSVMKQYKDLACHDVINIIDNIISSKVYTDDWTSEKSIVLVLSLMPVEVICIRHIDFVGQIIQNGHSYSIDSIFGDSIGKTLIKGNRKDLFLKLIEYVLTYKVNELTVQSEIGTYSLAEFVNSRGEEIARLWAEEVIQLIIKVMEEIISKKQYAFSVYEINAVDEISKDDFYSEFRDFLVKFLIIMLKDMSVPENIVEELLSRQHVIFKRIAVNYIDTNYSTLGKIFWDWNINPLEEIGLKHELFKLFENHSKEFSDYQIQSCIYWIESVSYHIPEEKLARKNEIIACLKKEWLFSLRGSGNSKIEDAYERYHSINPAILEHPGYDVWYSSLQPNESIAAAQKNKMQGLDVHELVEYLGSGRLKKYDKDNIAFEHEALWALESCVKEQPYKYIEAIDKLLDIPLSCQIYILSGFAGACKDGYPLNWSILLDFCNKLVMLQELGNRSNNKKIDYGSKRWITRNVISLIELGVSDDKQELNIELMKQFIDILFKVIDVHDITYCEYKGQSSVNCEAYSVIIQCLLRVAKMEGTAKDEISELILDKFEDTLDEATSSVDLNIVLGKYLSELYLLRADWVKNNILAVSNWSNHDNFKALIKGYFQNVKMVDKGIYLLLKDSNMLKQSIELGFSKELQDDGHFIQYILVAFLYDFKDAEKLLTRIIVKKDPPQISEIIRFLVSHQ